MTEGELNEIWHKVKTEVKKRKVDLPFWSALEVCVPVGIEDEQLVLGLRSEDYHRLGHLTTVMSRRTIEEVLSDLKLGITGYQVIPGVTKQEWEEEKERKQVRRQAAGETMERRRTEGETADRWFALTEELVRKHAATHQRNYPQVMAAFLLESLEEVHSLEAELEPNTSSELLQRNLARMLQKLSNYTGVDPVSVAVLYLRLKQEKKENKPAD